MRLLWLALLASGAGPLCGAQTGKIVIDDKIKNRVESEKKWRPYETRIVREERVHGEVLVLSPPLFVRGPPKGFPVRRRVKKQAAFRAIGRRLPVRNGTESRMHGEVLVHSSFINVGRTPSVRSSREVHPETSAFVISNQAIRELVSSRGINDLSLKGKRRTRRKRSVTEAVEGMWPYFLIPGMMTIGYAPLIISALKMFIMKAMMWNIAAFKVALLMTLTNMVFGPKGGGHTKYVNYGYQNHYKTPPPQHRFRSPSTAPLTI